MPRCPCCKRKTHIEIACGCGTKFCIECRLPEKHKCNVTFAPVVLEKVVAPKVDKI